MQNRRRLMIVRGGNRHVIIKFKSNGCGRAKLLQNRTTKQKKQQTNNKKDPDLIVCFTKKSDANGNELSNNKWQIKIFLVLIFFIISPILS